MNTEQKIRAGETVELPKMKTGTFLCKGEFFEGILISLYSSEDNGETFKRMQTRDISGFCAQFD